MGTVTVNPPKTPITEGSNGVAAATVPNVCKMPGPPAPFVPAPLPNIGKSGDSPKDYSKDVKVEGKVVAIQGATFKSMGDVASKGTGGGLISANTHGVTKFISPGSMNVKFEGKAVQLLGDMMLNNCADGGSPPNSATMLGALQPPGSPPLPPSELDCGEIGTYEDQKKRTGGGTYHRDHIPSKAALKARAAALKGKALTENQAKAVENLAISVVIPATAHREVSPTYGGRNQDARIQSDSKDLKGAAKRDTDEMKKEFDKHADAECVKAYEEAAEKIEKTTNEDYDNFLNNILKTVK